MAICFVQTGRFATALVLVAQVSSAFQSCQHVKKGEQTGNKYDIPKYLLSTAKNLIKLHYFSIRLVHVKINKAMNTSSMAACKRQRSGSPEACINRLVYVTALGWVGQALALLASAKPVVSDWLNSRQCRISQLLGSSFRPFFNLLHLTRRRKREGN